MSISFVLITFLLQMSVGMVVAVSLLPPKMIDPLFFKSISFWSWLFTALAMGFKHYAHFKLPEFFGPVIVPMELPRVVDGLFYLFLFLNLILWWRLRYEGSSATRRQLWLRSAVGLAAVVLDSLLFRPGLPPVWAQSILVPLHFVSSSMILGGFLAGMIFGHYYLVTTDMPKKLLVTMAWILIGIMAFRMAAVGATLLLHREVIHPNINFLTTLMSLQGHGIFFWQRVLVGLAVPSIVVFMIWGTARIGSNQSATGIMYVGIAFVFIGELAARYLFLLSGIPL